MSVLCPNQAARCFSTFYMVYWYIPPKPNLSRLGTKTKGFTGTTPWKVLCLYLWSSFYRWIGLANKWQPLRTAASAFWSASHEWNAVLRGCDQSSQRAEIYALLYCLAYFRGDHGVILQYIPVAWMFWIDLTAWWVVIFPCQCWVS